MQPARTPPIEVSSEVVDDVESTDDPAKALSRKYTSQELLQYKNCKFSLVPPSIEDPIIRSLSCWRKSSPLPEGEDTGKRNRHNSESRDPRERIRRESDGIILSPQRGNFNKGCFVDPPQAAPLSQQPASQSQQPQQQQQQQPQRRIGSGRIVNRDWECDTNGPFRPMRDDRNANADRSVCDRYQRPSDNRDTDGRHQRRHDDRKSNYRNNNHNNNNHDRFKETPEWFTSGPKSQNETIDLYGFDEKDVSPKKRCPKKDVKTVQPKEDVEEAKPKKNDEEVSASSVGKPFTCSTPVDKFNFEDFLTVELLQNDCTSNGKPAQQSRFSKFFKSAEIDDNVGKSLVDSNEVSAIDDGKQEFPPLSSAFFAPIDPAPVASTFMNFIDNIRADPTRPVVTLKDLAATGKVITNVNELEARMLQNVQKDAFLRNEQLKQQALRQLLLENIERGNNCQQMPPVEQLQQIPPYPVPPHNVSPDIQPPNFPPQEHFMPHPGQNFPPNYYPLPPMPQEDRNRPQHNDFLQRLIQQGHGSSINTDLFNSFPCDVQYAIVNAQITQEIIGRPEASALIVGLQQGKISVQNVVQQLQNAASQPRHKDLLASILKMVVCQNPGLPKLQTHANQPHNAFCSSALISPNAMVQNQNIPLQHPGLLVPHRVPSPHELMVHTANIMQGALIKKKLEEQRENFKKRQEMQRVGSPTNSGPKSPNPMPSTSAVTPTLPNPKPQLSFTPTSVLRKMTEKDEKSAPRGGAMLRMKMPMPNPPGVPPVMQPPPPMAYPVMQPQPVPPPQQSWNMPPPMGSPHPMQMPAHLYQAMPMGMMVPGFEVPPPISPSGNPLHRWFSNEPLLQNNPVQPSNTPHMVNVQELERLQQNPYPN